MFTGIITGQAVLREKKKTKRENRFTFELLAKHHRFQLGKSIAVDGVCLTVSAFKGNSFQADLIRETLQSTTLGKLDVGQRVNIEHPLRVGDRLGGHWVTGHVDGEGKIIHIYRQSKELKLNVRAPASIIRLIVKKGSIAIDGISFTIQQIEGRSFMVGVTPHTYRATTLPWKREGDSVNLENDLLMKSARQLTVNGHGSFLKERELRRNGF